jgi:hypothetical protein
VRTSAQSALAHPTLTVAVGMVSRAPILPIMRAVSALTRATSAVRADGGRPETPRTMFPEASRISGATTAALRLALPRASI